MTGRIRVSLPVVVVVVVVVAALGSTLAACGVSTYKDDDGRNKSVSVNSPVGNLSVKASSDTPPDTGLPVHAGARIVRDTDHDNANVNIDAGFFGVKVAVARYEDDAAPEAILEYYRKELARYGGVTECRGNLDFKPSGPRCKARAHDETSLGVGGERDNHVVSVKPRGNGSEFTLIHVQTRS